ncbi:hypothetical protein G7076_03225 [Sphingomonas sp. HDW15A]|uniref:hypothetical protein n=1 Tax=Sphingomonas sp. HDW15A TaxID=2714942 RepID=UPI00140DBF37|nr:hypothetical protein [Sphingomonas sp. HDW15A]QIK95619.1 hypothetical protein G7076_03225 [Sphingomonas sp. HDW15A]
MRNWIIGVAALAAVAISAPTSAQQSSMKDGQFWTASRIDVEEGQMENYLDYVAKTWIPNQEFAKSQGWISDYYVLNNINARDGEPELILITRFAEIPSVAEGERRNAVMNERMKLDDHSAEAASGVRSKMRRLAGSILYRELTKR